MLVAVQAVGAYLLNGYLFSYLTKTIGMAAVPALVTNGIAVLTIVVLLPVFGGLADRVGRKKLMYAGAAWMAVASYPALQLAATGTIAGALTGQLILAFGVALFAAGGFVTMLEMFQTSVRFAGHAISYNLGYAVFGGTTPLIAASLVSSSGSNMAPAFYMTAIAILGLLTVAFTRETRDVALLGRRGRLRRVHARTGFGDRHAGEPVMTRYETINVGFANGIIDVELNRPDRMNAINLTIARELIDAASSLAHREDAEVLVIRGAGRAFSAGADVGAAPEHATGDAGSEGSVATEIAAHAEMRDAIAAIEALPVVKIAQVHGHCVGAGRVLASMCEIRIASQDAQFSIPELAFGIPFSMGGLPRIVRYIGLTRTADLVLTGRRMPAAEAQAAGLVTDVVEATELPARVAQTAATIAAHPKLLIMETVDRLREAGVDLLDGSRSDLGSLALAMRDPEHKSSCANMLAGCSARVPDKRDTRKVALGGTKAPRPVDGHTEPSHVAPGRHPRARPGADHARRG